MLLMECRARDISVIAPDDIASIDVLKDAAATAIYGNRASSGVLLLQQKQDEGPVTNCL